MTTPEQPQSSPLIPASWLQPVIDVHADAESMLIAAISTRLGRELDSQDWATRRAPDLSVMRRDMDRILARLAELSEPAVTQALARAYERGRGTTGSAPRNLVEAILEALRAAWLRTRASVTRAWNQAIVSGDVQPDEQTRRQAVQRRLDRIADRGIEAFRDSRGRPISLRPYVEQTVTDGAHDAGMGGFTDRLEAGGGDLVIVTRSPHPCPLCDPWEARVLSVTGSDPRRPSMATARAAGLFHPRCRHTVFAWQQGFAWPPHSIERQPGTYEAEQRQRTIERSIRQWKRRQAAALDDTARMVAGRKVRGWQAELRTHLAAEHLKRSRLRERTDFGHTRPLKHALGA